MHPKMVAMTVLLLAAVTFIPGAALEVSVRPQPVDDSIVPAAPATLPRITSADFIYLGAFRAPYEDRAGNPLTWGGYALAVNPSGATEGTSTGLFIGCHAWRQRLAEIAIPSTVNLSETAALRQDCTDVTEGRLDLVDDMPNLGGALVYGGRLIVSVYGYYDADVSQTRSHFASSTDLAQTGDVVGPEQVGEQAGVVAGYMTTIPEEWQTHLGGPALTGQCCIPIISRTSAGPAASVFDPEDVGRRNPVPATPLLHYPLEHPLAPEDAQNNLFNLTTQIVGMAFPPGSRSLLFIGRHGIGPYCYGAGEECDDPVESYKGPHAYPYVHQVWAYDVLDLLSVKQGQLRPWEVQPYAVWRLTEMDDVGGASIAGAAFDPDAGRLYITEQYGDEPLVHVYRLTAATPTFCQQPVNAPGQHCLHLPLIAN